MYVYLASFPGLPAIQFFIACSVLQIMKSWTVVKPWNKAMCTVVSHKYTPPPFCNLSLSTKRRGGGLNAGCDNFSRDYALPSDKA